MFTVRVEYPSGQIALMQCDQVQVMSDRRLLMMGGKQAVPALKLDDGDTAYVMNVAGKTIHTVHAKAGGTESRGPG